MFNKNFGNNGMQTVDLKCRKPTEQNKRVMCVLTLSLFRYLHTQTIYNSCGPFPASFYFRLVYSQQKINVLYKH